MAKIPLRLYIKDIEVLIDHGQIDEAIAHCRFIIQQYPKLVSAYQMLGKAYLEGKRYSDAADLFQRVLSSVPDDYVSHIGMSIIREDEGNLNAAIWHMERAFEIQPYNPSIQGELRRLYGRRDGMQPPKVRLTRGALARMYAQGNLFQQAIGELRAALAEDHQRVDLQALLARMYFLTGQRVEAVETCSQILKKFPYCLEANRILAIILPETGRKEDAQAYKQRLLTLDPYLAHAAPQAPNSKAVSDNAVTVDHLDYRTVGGPELPTTTQPAWAASLGVSIEDFATTKEEALPSWLTSEEEGVSIEGIEAYSGPETPPFVGFATETTEAPAPLEPAVSEVSEQKAEELPDWMKEAGWQAGGGVEEEPALGVAQPEGTIAESEIPDWLQSMAPKGIEEEIPMKVEEESQEEVLPWLQETPPGPTDTIISWLGEKKEAAVTPSETLPSQAGKEIPDWLHDINVNLPAESEAAAEPTTEAEVIPDWLAAPVETTPGETETAGEPTLAIEEPSAPSSALPEWLSTPFKEDISEVEAKAEQPLETIPPIEPEPLSVESIEQLPAETIVEIPAPPETLSVPVEEGILTESQPAVQELPSEAAPVEGVPDWLKDLAQGIISEETAAPIVAETESTAKTGITDWLKGLEPTPEVVSTVEEPTSLPAEEEALPTEELPSWLAGIQEEIPSEKLSPELEITVPGAEEPEVTGEALPDWLQAIEAEIPKEPTEVPAEPIVAAPIAAGSEQLPTDQEAGLAWLEGLAAKQGVPEEELLTTPEQRSEIQPGWTQEEQPEVELAEKLGAKLPAEEILPDEIPLAQLEGINLEGQDAALAWLETLAQKQGIPEEELITSPEEMAEVPPAWIEELKEEVAPPLGQETIAPVTKAAAETLVEQPTAEAIPPGEMPEWLKEIALPPEEEVEIPTQPVRVSEEAPAVPSEAQIEEWAPTPAEEPVETVAPSEAVVVEPSLSEQEALAWLESLAVKQGVPEEELLTKPEERVETPPTWVLEEKPTEVPITEEIVPPPVIEEISAEETAPAIGEVEVPEWIKEAPVSEIVEPTSLQPAEEAPAVAEIPELTEVAAVELPIVEAAIPAEMPVPAPSPVELLDINSASLVELERIPGIGFIRAQYILNYRDEYGAFNTLDELTKVPEISLALIDDLRQYVMVKEMKPEAIPPEIKPGISTPPKLEEAHVVETQGSVANQLTSYASAIKQSGQLEDAISGLHKLLSQYPKNAYAWQILGDAYLRNNQLSEAFEAYSEAEKCV